MISYNKYKIFLVVMVFCIIYMGLVHNFQNLTLLCKILHSFILGQIFLHTMYRLFVLGNNTWWDKIIAHICTRVLDPGYFSEQPIISIPTHDLQQHLTFPFIILRWTESRILILMPTVVGTSFGDKCYERKGQL